MSLPRPFDIPDRGYDAAFGPDAGEQPAGAKVEDALNHTVNVLPNGLRIAFSIGHLDQMPRCDATGLAVHFCRHCDDVSHNFHDIEDAPDAQ